MSDIADDMAVDEIGPPRGEEPGRWYRRICDLGNGDTSGSIVWIVDRVDPAQLAAQAEDRVPIPAPAIRMNPDASDGSVVHVPTRSEEHTSELQSLMRRSYAVFCLKKQNRKTQSI